MSSVTFRDYDATRDEQGCLALFDANCPAYFAPNERDDYQHFLSRPPEHYRVCLLKDEVVGAYGLIANETIADLCWLIVSPSLQQQGIGTEIMKRVCSQAREQGRRMIRIATSHKAKAFFEKFGAESGETIPDGWGPGMHRVDMTLSVKPSN